MKAQTVLLACCGLVLNVLAADNFWTLDSTELTNWASDNWSLVEKPSAANPAKIPQNAGTAAKWKNANILVNTYEQPGAFTLGVKNYSSNRIEIAKGGVIVNNSFTACSQQNVYSELVFNGGVMTNYSGTSGQFLASTAYLDPLLKIVMNEGEWFFERTHIGYRAPAKVEMNGGRLVNRCTGSTYGLHIGEDKSKNGSTAEWKQTGGEVDVDYFRFYNGTASMSGGRVKSTLGFEVDGAFTGTDGVITGGSVIFAGEDTSLKDMTIEGTGFTLGCSNTPDSSRKYSIEDSTVSATGNSFFLDAQVTVANSSMTFEKNLTFRTYVTGDNVKTSTLDIASGSLNCNALHLNDQPENKQLGPVIIRQTGGKVTVDTLYYYCTLRPEMYFLYEISGGTNVVSSGIGANHTSATNGILIRVIGNRGNFTYNYPIPQGADNIMPPFFEHVIADGEISQTRQTGSYNAYWYFMCALHPQGGLQMTTNTVFDQLYKFPQSDSKYATYFDRCRWGEGLFTTNGTGTAATKSTSVAAKWAFDPVADITSTMAAADGGFTSAAGVPWGWYDLPPVRTNALKRALVSLTLEPKAKTFAQLKDGFQEAGYKVAAADAATGQVTLELPIGRLGNNATDRRLFFDFTEYRTPRDIYEGHRTTNAVVKAISYTREKLGLILLVR